jgi:hypothetical protein
MYMSEQKYSAYEHRKECMINHNESDLHRLGIEPGSPDSQSNALPYDLTSRS